MTHIPGTDKISYAIPKEKEIPEKLPTPLSIVNISEMKKAKLEKSSPENKFWYHSFLYWFLLGSVPSIVLTLLGLIFDWRFLLLAPSGIIVATISWQVKTVFKRHEKKIDVLS